MKRYRNILILMSLALVTIAALGCSNFGYENGVVTVDVTLGVDTLNKIVDNVGIDSDDFVGKVERIELIEPNIMRITGDFKLLGTAKNGSIDFAITTGKDGVHVDVVKSTIPGVDGNTPAVKTFSKALGKALSAFAAENSDSKGGITDINVKDGQLVFTLSLKVQ